jgi:TRAP-type C4-dicarboxylate transport system substrate-binding protein
LQPASRRPLRRSHANSPGEIAHNLFNELGERVNRRTNGAVTIRVFPSEQLRKEADLVQQIKSGALDISAPLMPVISSLVPAMEMASGPFLWRDRRVHTASDCEGRERAGSHREADERARQSNR